MDAMWQSRLFERFWTIAGAAPIRVKVLGIVLGIIMLLGGFVMLQIRDLLTATLLQELEQQGVALSDTVAAHLTSSTPVDDPAALNTLLAEQLSHYSNNSHNTRVEHIIIEDASGEMVAGTARDTLLDSRPDDRPQQHSATLLDHGQILEIVRPGAKTNDHLRLGLATRNVRVTVDTVTFQLFTITLVMIAVGFAAAFFLTWILTRPLLDLVAATHAVARGDFSRRVPRWANDEIGELAAAFNIMTESLGQAEAERAEREQLRERYVSGVIVAQENERQRIARELHDSTSQSLTSLLVGLQNLKHAQTDAGVNSHIDDLRAIISGTLDEVRTISWRLRPSALDDLGLLSALRHYAQDYQKQFGIQVDLVVSGIEKRLPLEMETAIYRIIQEGLTNIARYAQATTASVIINQRHNLIRIVVEDNGVGFDPATIKHNNKSLGLQGIRERASLFDGKLTIESQPDQGTTLYIEIPHNQNRTAIWSQS